jgi:hypothetical protein
MKRTGSERLLGLFVIAADFCLFNGSDFPSQIADGLIQMGDGATQTKPFHNPHTAHENNPDQTGNKNKHISRPFNVEKIVIFQFNGDGVFQGERDDEKDKKHDQNGIDDFHINPPDNIS